MGGILAPTLDEIPDQSDSEDNLTNGSRKHIFRPGIRHAAEGANPTEHLIDDENPELKGYPTAGKTFGDDLKYTQFHYLINNMSQPSYCTGDSITHH
jgi:hypothetical protein